MANEKCVWPHSGSRLTALFEFSKKDPTTGTDRSFFRFVLYGTVKQRLPRPILTVELNGVAPQPEQVTMLVRGKNWFLFVDVPSSDGMIDQRINILLKNNNQAFAYLRKVKLAKSRGQQLVSSGFAITSPQEDEVTHSHAHFVAQGTITPGNTLSSATLEYLDDEDTYSGICSTMGGNWTALFSCPKNGRHGVTLTVKESGSPPQELAVTFTLTDPPGPPNTNGDPPPPNNP